MLNVPVHLGQGSDKRIVLAHGFTQSGEVWLSLAERLSAAGYEVIAPDLPGHGKTPAGHDKSDLWDAGRLLGEVGGKATYIGYSFGGRALLHLAVSQPDLVERMVLIGAKDGYTDPEKAAQRTADDNALADSIEKLGAAGRLSEFIDQWLKHPVNIRLPQEATHRELRLRNRPEGMASSLRYCGSGPQGVLGSRLAELPMPSLIMYAEYDTETILADVDRLVGSFGPNSRRLRVDGVGHSIPFEAPDVFATIVEQFAAGQWPDQLRGQSPEHTL